MDTQNVNRAGSQAGMVIAAAVAAASAMYFLDPQSGRRRRALARDQLDRVFLNGQEFLRKANTDTRQRALGLYRESIARFDRSPVDDATLEQRVRAELGRLTSHPHGIQVICNQQVVRLRGDVLASEVNGITRGIARVRGVKDVVNELQIYESNQGVSSLQGESNRHPRPPLEFLQENWSPGPRMLAGTAGLALLGQSLSRRSPTGIALGAIGAALLLRSVSNRPFADVVSMTAEPEAGVHVQKTIHVYADPDEAYRSYRQFENFPQFMSHVREVTKINDRLYRWRVDGVGGVPITFDSEVTADVPGELIAWRTIAGAPVQSSGVVQFEASSVGGTRMHVRMSYRPPANAIGHTIAKLFGRDPKHQIDDDLMRFKSYIEGTATPTTAGESASVQPGEVRH